MATVLRQAEGLTIDEPGQLSGQFVLLALRRDNGHREATFKPANDRTLDLPDMFEIDDDARPDFADDGGDQSYAAGAYINRLTRKFASILKHIAAQHG